MLEAIVQTIERLVPHWIAFIKAHEKLFLYVIAALTLVHFGDKVYDAYGKHLDHNTAADTVIVQQIQKQNADTVATLTKAIETMNERFTADEALIAKAKTTIIVQQQKNDKMPVTELDKHWESILGLPDTSITANADGTSTVSGDAAHQTVNALDTIQPLNVQLSATKDELTQCTQVRTQQAALITGLQTESAGKTKQFDDLNKQYKHDVRSAWKRGFKWGFIAGAGVVTFARAALHI